MNEMPRTLKIVTIWLLLGLGVFLAVQAHESHQSKTRFNVAGDRIEIRRAGDGHYHWPGQVEGRPVEFLVDTGASSTVISTDLARSLGLSSRGVVRSQTAGGVVEGQVVQADITLEGGVVARNLRIIALPDLGDRPLLGMDVLGRLRWQQHEGVLSFDLRQEAR